MTTYKLQDEKPEFKNGDRIKFRIDDKIKGEGTIIGISSRHIIDSWIVLIDKSKTPEIKNYEYDACIVFHTLIYKNP